MTKQKKMMKITLRKKCYMLDNQFLKYSKKDKNSFYTLKPRGPNDRATFQLQVFCDYDSYTKGNSISESMASPPKRAIYGIYMICKILRYALPTNGNFIAITFQKVVQIQYTIFG